MKSRFAELEVLCCPRHPLHEENPYCGGAQHLCGRSFGLVRPDFKTEICSCLNRISGIDEE